ncbi:hypothetical protein [Thalassomonas haliotis]|uniref:Uncharacterized protein n=1 Tax=Thalassomonas haliotis TaxID=485448 RepID=A0ABY7VH33_9GAMM|nr:hypothetical protein [Thalassomonas haliotis]WDE11982.1 hypothetical protein H3N35_00370 [Thalassomonas haliotis]
MNQLMNQDSKAKIKQEIKQSSLPSASSGSGGPGPDPKEVIKRFTGKVWEVTDVRTKTEDRTKDRYYPSKGGKLQYYLVEENDEVFAKVKVLEGEPFESRTAMESAYFRVFDDALLSSPMIIQFGIPGLALSEVLTLNKERTEMTHHLTFSDGVHGSWVCKD